MCLFKCIETPFVCLHVASGATLPSSFCQHDALIDSFCALNHSVIWSFYLSACQILMEKHFLKHLLLAVCSSLHISNNILFTVPPPSCLSSHLHPLAFLHTVSNSVEHQEQRSSKINNLTAVNAVITLSLFLHACFFFPVLSVSIFLSVCLVFIYYSLFLNNSGPR